MQWTLTGEGIRLEVHHEGGDSQRHADEVLHWLEMAWATGWTQHAHVTEFARPVPPLDVTVTLDPVAVADRNSACTCGLCTWARPRIQKWGAKRKSLSELYRRIGEGEDVAASDVVPLIGAHNLQAAGKKPPKKSATLSAAEARDWLALNPNRAF